LEKSSIFISIENPCGTEPQQMWRFGIIGRMVLPHNLYAHMSHADLFDGNIFLRPLDFLPQGAVLTTVAQLCASISEARLSALTARIRPHFLFNSLNAAISLIRLRPYEYSCAHSISCPKVLF
jgi:hypothetical protein